MKIYAISLLGSMMIFVSACVTDLAVGGPTPPDEAMNELAIAGVTLSISEKPFPTQVAFEKQYSEGERYVNIDPFLVFYVLPENKMSDSENKELYLAFSLDEGGGEYRRFLRFYHVVPEVANEYEVELQPVSTKNSSLARFGDYYFTGTNSIFIPTRATHLEVIEVMDDESVVVLSRRPLEEVYAWNTHVKPDL